MRWWWGPWVHGRVVSVRRKSPLGRVELWSEHGGLLPEEYPVSVFFEAYLRGDGNAKLPKAYMFETGTDVWRQYASWAAEKCGGEDTFIFTRNGVLSFEAAETKRRRRMTSNVSEPGRNRLPFVNYVAQTVPAGIHGVGPAIRGVGGRTC